MTSTTEAKHIDSAVFGEFVQRWAADGIYVVDKAGNIKGGNDRLWAMLGLSQAPDGPSSLLNYVVADERAITLRTWQLVANHRRSERVLRRLRTARGDSKVWSTIESPVMSGQDVSLIVGVARDVTEEAEIEDKLWGAQENSQAALEYSVRASMGLIKGYVYSLNKLDTMPEDAKNRFGRIVAEEIDTMARNIENLLMSRGNYHSNEEALAFDLSETIKECIDIHKSEGERRQITMLFDAADKEVTFFGQPLAIVRIVSNLIDFLMLRLTHSGEIKIELRDLDEYVEIALCDNGGQATDELLDWLMKTNERTANSSWNMAGSKFDFDVARLLSESLGGGIMARPCETRGLELTVMLPRSLYSTMESDSSVARTAI